MKYYLIYFADGLVVDISTFDDEESRDARFVVDTERLPFRDVLLDVHVTSLQCFNQVY